MVSDLKSRPVYKVIPTPGDYSKLEPNLTPEELPLLAEAQTKIGTYMKAAAKVLDNRGEEDPVFSSGTLIHARAADVCLPHQVSLYIILSTGYKFKSGMHYYIGIQQPAFEKYLNSIEYCFCDHCRRTIVKKTFDNSKLQKEYVGWLEAFHSQNT